MLHRAASLWHLKAPASEKQTRSKVIAGKGEDCPMESARAIALWDSNHELGF